MNYLGPGPLKVYGQSNRYGRRRPHIKTRLLDDKNKTKCYETSFWVEGPQNRKALVNLQVVEEDDAKDSRSSSKISLKERFLSVELVERGNEKIILIQPKMETSRFRWNPFSKLFSS